MQNTDVMEPRKTGVEAVSRALTILSAFDENSQVLSLAELAARTGLYKSTILRIAATLEAHQFISRQADGSFRLGSELWRLGSLYRRGFDLGEHVRPVLRQLVKDTQETASFYIRDGDSRICLYRLNSPRPTRHHLDEGVRLPLERGAAGRLLLMLGDCGERIKISEPPAFLVSRGERDPEVGAVAAPVIDRERRLRGALSVSTLLSRFDAAAERTITACLLRAARALSDTIPLDE